MNWGLCPRDTRTHPFHSERANSLRGTPHTPLSKSETIQGQSHGARPKPRPFLMAMFKIPLTSECREPILLRCILCIRSFINIIGTALVLGAVYTGFRSSCDVSQACDISGPLHMLPHLFLLYFTCLPPSHALVFNYKLPSWSVPSCSPSDPPLPLFLADTCYLFIHITMGNYLLSCLFTCLLSIYKLQRGTQVHLPYSPLYLSTLCLIKCDTHNRKIFFKISKIQINLGKIQLKQSLTSFLPTGPLRALTYWYESYVNRKGIKAACTVSSNSCGHRNTFMFFMASFFPWSILCN